MTALGTVMLGKDHTLLESDSRQSYHTNGSSGIDELETEWHLQSVM